MYLNMLEVKDHRKKVVLLKQSENLDDLVSSLKTFLEGKELLYVPKYDKISCTDYEGYLIYNIRFKDKDRYNFPESKLAKIVEEISD